MTNIDAMDSALLQVSATDYVHCDAIHLRRFILIMGLFCSILQVVNL